MNKISHKKRNFNHFSITERKLIQDWFRKKIPVIEIATRLGRHRSSIYRQISNRKNTDWVKINSKAKRTYVAQLAHHNYIKNKSNCGAKYKIFKDPNLVDYLNYSIKYKKYSPDVALGRAKVLGIDFTVNVCKHTVYNAIDRGQLNATNFDLLQKLSRKPTKKKSEPKQKENKRNLGKSIELRPDIINKRLEFGHWEGDTVVDKNQNGILVLVERQSRYGIICKLKKHDSKNVNQRISALKYRTKCFSKIFKSITFDNGSEFTHVTNFENENLDIYFTRPYSSWEKGAVENYNGIIRRYISKGTDISKLTKQTIQSINSQINNIPRKILGYLTAAEYFEDKLNSILA